ncbi:DUF2878 domain-containing protein [Vibrio sp. 404]|uniref:DUF2878 domain-containing protein n=2 Tax=Vibrio marinisediminis TaxID=2758441 RepID=A0A7W2FQY7_9VIBR|nr:DUF2878 domain-containing protein [Vibrio marinisediminis]
MSPLTRLLIVSTWFQLLWCLAVLGRDTWQWFTVMLVVMTLIFSAWRGDFNWRTGFILLMFGVVIDIVNTTIGLLVFDAAPWSSYIALPIWLLALWAIFSWYAQFLVPMLSRYPLLIVSIVGGLAGAASYIAGYKLDAVSLGFSTSVAFAIFFIEWSVIVLLCMKILNIEAVQDEKDKLA